MREAEQSQPHHPRPSHDHGRHSHSHDYDSHDHGGHGHSHDFREAGLRSLVISLVLISGYMVPEIIGGILSGSLALLSDGVHMLSHAIAIGVALFAMWIAGREVSPERTFGYHRTEVIAALYNALFLWLISGWIFYEAFHRVSHAHLEAQGLMMFIIGVGGLIINVIVVIILHRTSGQSVNIEAAFWHVFVDLLASVGVVVSAILVWAFGWGLADLMVGVLIALLTLGSSWGLLKKVLPVLMEGTPEHVDVYRLCAAMEDVPGVTLVHDVHCWTIVAGYEVLMAHVLLDPTLPAEEVEPLLRRLRRIAKQDFDITHVTLQVEQTLEDCTEGHHVGHLEALERGKKKGILPF